CPCSEKSLQAGWFRRFAATVCANRCTTYVVLVSGTF
ncbi:MAG: hypothetical protein QOI08_4400, partial [Actinomycetota bacterium]|nr:hypothetical protein [Actinomycetota bacterium]